MKKRAAIFGAGPSGSCTSIFIKKNDPDADVLLLEKHSSPVSSCAGGIGWHFAEKTCLEIPPEVILVRLKKVTLHGPTEQISLTAKDFNIDVLGYVLDRKAFDLHWINEATKLGVEYRHNIENYSVSRDKKCATVKIANEEFQADYLVDATGYSASIARELGYPVERKPWDCHRGVQTISKLPDWQEQDEIKLFFDNKYSPKGYVWSFPIGNGLTRLGVGVDLEQQPPIFFLNKFLQEHPLGKSFQDLGPKNGGLIPTARPGKTYFGNLALVGDAANFCSPLHGGGIIFAISGAKCLGETIAKGQDLGKYEKRWKKEFGSVIDKHYAMKRFLYGIKPEYIDRAIILAKGYKIHSQDVYRETMFFGAYLIKTMSKAWFQNLLKIPRR